MPRRLLFLLLGLTALLSCARSYAAGNAEAAYAEGVAAFRAGDYTHACDDFLQARAAGYRGAQLDYSLGAAYYRLGRYAEARREFEELLNVPALAALIHYNLGLIAAAQGNPDRARREYQNAYAAATQPDIRRLAAAQLARLPPPPAPPLRWFGYSNLYTGYDDNVALAPQSGVTLPSRQASPLMSVLAGGYVQMTGTYANGLQVSGSYYGTDYQRLSQYNETMLSLGSQYNRTSGGWSARVGVTGSDVTLGGAAFETLGTVQVAGGKQIAAGNHLTFGYQYQHVSGGQSFDYLSGWQQQTFVLDEITTSGYTATLGYQHETNRRNDLTLGAEFLSASPTRNRLYAQLALHAADSLDWDLGFTYEKSLYGKPDILVTGNTLATIGRNDTLYIGRLAAKYKLAKRWDITAEYRYLRNASNVDIYSYQSNRYTLAIEYLFY
ncbi:MAG: tetratricopeptide repeat protein [Gammaproteobacteria bacterium]|nr:tetratricopeptide repeat protein [Gammaproteobacteria bacterium]MDE1984310.1 tetratricopeptide repeat protein [Gammaproteobacteria bacterium]MDE2108880.1 tetratricopeptide repeat protein [Gammaproteobacteria bacterium]MDE2462007.1 tetratricopeptide repeat protein [Gammaproteobacteria bacterium]